jgi:cysteine synthase
MRLSQLMPSGVIDREDSLLAQILAFILKPFGSISDRSALAILLSASKSGALQGTPSSPQLFSE